MDRKVMRSVSPLYWLSPSIDKLRVILNRLRYSWIKFNRTLQCSFYCSRLNRCFRRKTFEIFRQKFSTVIFPLRNHETLKLQAWIIPPLLVEESNTSQNRNYNFYILYANAIEVRLFSKPFFSQSIEYLFNDFDSLHKDDTSRRWC